MNFPKDSDFLFVSNWDEELYQKALVWAKGKKRAAFLSEEMRESASPNVKIYPLESSIQKEVLLKRIAWSAVLQKMHIIGERDIELWHHAAQSILSEASDFWVKAFSNARANHSAYRRGLSLKGAFQGTAAVIVGAGPSLERHGSILKELKEKALIFAGGSALNLIDVEPDFAASIDPHEELKRNRFLKAPFCYQSRMNPKNFSSILGEKILFPDCACPGINWIYGEEMFDGGWTVGNFLTSVAVHFGCSPILFLGMDFCYEKGKKYAKVPKNFDGNLIEVEGKFTQPDFLMAAKWTENLAKGHSFFKIGEEGLLNLERIQSFEFLQRGSKTFKETPLISKARWEEWDASLLRCQKDIKEEEIVYQMLLEPLWQIWRAVFEREVELDARQKIELHKLAFFQNVLEQHVRA